MRMRPNTGGKHYWSGTQPLYRLSPDLVQLHLRWRAPASKSEGLDLFLLLLPPFTVACLLVSLSPLSRSAPAPDLDGSRDPAPSLLLLLFIYLIKILLLFLLLPLLLRLLPLLFIGPSAQDNSRSH